MNNGSDQVRRSDSSYTNESHVSSVVARLRQIRTKSSRVDQLQAASTTLVGWVTPMQSTSLIILIAQDGDWDFFLRISPIAGPFVMRRT